MDLGLALLSLVCVGYMFARYEYVVNRFPTADPLSAADMTIGITATLLVLEAARRTIGASLSVVAIVFIAYALAGHWLPGWLHHRRSSSSTTRRCCSMAMDRHTARRRDRFRRGRGSSAYCSSPRRFC